jgi:hypothetical protein
MDVGDSLRQKVERSMLLEDSAVIAPRQERVDRWPQFFGIAAIFMLVASLFFILYKALGPTLRPAVFTQTAIDRQTVEDKSSPLSIDEQTAKLPDQKAQPTIDTMTALGTNMPQTPQTRAPGEAMVPVSPQTASPFMQKAQNLAMQSQQQIVAAAQLDMPAIRRQLQNSGYGITGGANAKTAPVLLVVDSTDMSATKAQINQFISSNSGMSWNAVPAVISVAAAPTTLSSSALASGLPAMSANLDKNAFSTDLGITDKVAANELYVARGLTPERVDALKQTLTLPQQNGLASVQVTVQSAEGLATTQPSIETQKNVNVFGMKEKEASDNATNGNAATQPSELSANRAMDLAGGAAATQPSQTLNDYANAGPGGFGGGGGFHGAGSDAAKNNSPMNDDKLEYLQQEDAVIILQTAEVSNAASATQPSPVPSVAAPIVSPTPAAPPPAAPVPSPTPSPALSTPAPPATQP